MYKNLVLIGLAVVLLMVSGCATTSPSQRVVKMTDEEYAIHLEEKRVEITRLREIAAIEEKEAYEQERIFEARKVKAEAKINTARVVAIEAEESAKSEQAIKNAEVSAMSAEEKCRTGRGLTYGEIGYCMALNNGLSHILGGR